jgi:tRNA U34 5-methylaminomethyl-2-thiouridine-forming methyltransferase MnmC
MNSSMNPPVATAFAGQLGEQAASLIAEPDRLLGTDARPAPATSLTTLLAAIASRRRREDASWKVKAQEFMAG